MSGVWSQQNEDKFDQDKISWEVKVDKASRSVGLRGASVSRLTKQAPGCRTASMMGAERQFLARRGTRPRVFEQPRLDHKQDLSFASSWYLANIQTKGSGLPITCAIVTCQQ